MSTRGSTMPDAADQTAVGAVRTVTLEGVPFAAVTEQDVVDFVFRGLKHARGGWLVPMNVDVLLRWTRDPSIPTLCGGADLFLADGMPLLWAAKLRRTPLPQRVAGSTMIRLLCAEAGRQGRSVFLLGGDPGTADAAAASLREACPGLIIAGTYCPRMGFEKDPEQLKQMRDAISSAAPDLVFVGLGFPKQERLIQELRPFAAGAWWVGVGISFSFLSGRIQRAPLWIQQLGFEWMHRMSQEPGRLGRRYLIDDVPFALMLLAKSALVGARWFGSV